MRISSPALVLALLCAVQAGALLSRWMPSLTAFAQENPTPAAPSRTFVCRAFPGDVDKDRGVNTSDRTTEIGQWVGEREVEGLRVERIDFEIGQKPTGYPQAWMQVCMVPAG